MPGVIDLIYILLAIFLCYALYRIFMLAIKGEKKLFDKMEKKDETPR